MQINNWLGPAAKQARQAIRKDWEQVVLPQAENGSKAMIDATVSFLAQSGLEMTVGKMPSDSIGQAMLKTFSPYKIELQVRDSPEEVDLYIAGHELHHAMEQLHRRHQPTEQTVLGSTVSENASIRQRSNDTRLHQHMFSQIYDAGKEAEESALRHLVGEVDAYGATLQHAKALKMTPEDIQNELRLKRAYQETLIHFQMFRLNPFKKVKKASIE